MEHRTFFRWSTFLSLGGTLFALYLTLSKFSSGVCPFNEPCPYFLGYPACWYGLGLFVLLFLASLFGLMGKGEVGRGLWFIRLVALLGMLFAGYFVMREFLGALQYDWPSYTLLLPTCAYGFIFYGILFWLAERTLQSMPNPSVVPKR